jgi:hypothetical protein
MSALTSRLTSLSSKSAVIVVSIDGVPLDFTASMAGPAPAAPRLDGRGLLVSVEESRTILDRQQRMQVGGGATIVVQDRNNLLRSLFAVRSFRSTFITALTSKTATTVPVADTTTLPVAPGVVYVGSETIQYTSTTATSLEGCTRGAFGSKAQAHRGGAETGNGAFTVPPSWLGRRVRLSVQFLDDDGRPDTSFGTEALATFRLEAGPIDKGRGCWELRCSHLSDEVTKRKLGTGIREVELTVLSVAIDDVSLGLRTIKFGVHPGTAPLFKLGSPSQRTQALITTDDGRFTFNFGGVLTTGAGRHVHDIYTVIDGGHSVKIYLLPTSRTDGPGLSAYLRAADTSSLGVLSRNPPIKDVKHIAVLDGESPGRLLLRALTSRNGDTANGPDDVLPGVEATAEGGLTLRFGAGIELSEIDTGSVLAAESNAPGWSWIIDEEIPVSELLRDFCRATNTAVIFNATGQLTFTPLLEQRVNAVATIAEADVVGDIATTVDEGAVYARVRVECNYDPVDGESEASIDVIDEEIADTYGNAENTLVIESRDLVVRPVAKTGDGTLIRPLTQLDALLPSLRRSMLDGRGGSLLLTFTASAKHLGLQLGDFVAVSMPSVSDYRGGSLADAQGRVIERQPDWQTMTIALTVLVTERLFHFAPFAVVVSTSDSVVISTATFGTSSPASPATSFRVGDVLSVYDPVANVVVGDGVQVTGIPSTISLSLSNASASPSLPVSPGWVLLLKSSTGTTSTDGFTPADYTYGNGGTQPSRWR